MEQLFEDMELFGLNFEPKVFWDIVAYSAVRMKEETETEGIPEDRYNWLMRRIELAEELMKRIPFQGNGILEMQPVTGTGRGTH